MRREEGGCQAMCCGGGVVEGVVVRLCVVGEEGGCQATCCGRDRGVVVRLCVCILFVLTLPCVTQGCMLEFCYLWSVVF